MGVLWLCGPSGAGKTYQVKKMAREWENSGARVQVLDCEDLVAELLDRIRKSWDADWVAEVSESFSEIDVLIIEQMDTLVYKTGTQDTVTDLISQLCAKGKHVILTSIVPPKQLGCLQRLPDLRIEKLALPDQGKREQIVEEMCEELELDLSPDAKAFVAAGAMHGGQIRGALQQCKLMLQVKEMGV